MKKLLIVLLSMGSLFALTFKDVADSKHIFFYAGDIVSRQNFYKKFIGLSLSRSNAKHIKHDITKPFPLRDNCVDMFQAEDVFEHIEYQVLPSVINEIYRILKPGGYARISIPDYQCDVLYTRCKKNSFGDIVFDPGGGGAYQDGRVIKGGHVWFPMIGNVKNLVNMTEFAKKGRIVFYHYYDEKGQSVTKSIDYSKGFVKRTPDHDKRVNNPYRAMSLVFDLFKD